MRPEVLFSLFTPVVSLDGVGGKFSKLIERLCGSKVVDLLWHLPCGYIDRRFSPAIANAPDGAIVTLTVTVGSHCPPANKRVPYRIACFDDTGSISLVFFRGHKDYLQKILPEGSSRIVSGRVEYFNFAPQITHPDHIGTPEEKDKIMIVEPVYPMTTGLSSKILLRTIHHALDRTTELPEWLDKDHKKREGWLSWHESLLKSHNPDGEVDISPLAPARARLAYDELLANQLTLALIRRDIKSLAGISINGDNRLREKVHIALPFALTNAQKCVLEEINTDMASDSRMLRLLQGDVGSGKTIVALLSMLNAVEEGKQAAFMVPTDILSRQHLATIEPLLKDTGVKIALLTGRDKGKKRTEILESLASGELDIIIGTHALFQKDVVFNDLGLSVIDEQHRFGVHQRLHLTEKGKQTDILVMTATPIPRTLTMTFYGDMDVSKLDEFPPNRKPVDTRVAPISRLEEIVAATKRAVSDGARVFWVCPLVEESEKLDLAAAEVRFEYLQHVFGNKVGLVHGRMKGEEKDAVMEAFSSGEIDILVATTVIEVGVDVPEATVMVIEHAERFGLAQLHQLRGRIGRSDRQSTCILLYGMPLTETAKSRLTIMKETEDGFKIAEEDLRLRGAGEILGTKQSGMLEFKMADINIHSNLLTTARNDARLMIKQDPHLKSERGMALRTLLYLFEQDAVFKNLRSG